MVTLRDEDDDRHTPADDNPRWSESWVFNGYDPKNDLWFVVRLGLEPNRGKANLSVFLAVEGKEVYNRTRKDLPLPGGSIVAGMEVDGFRVSSSKLMKDYHLTFEDATFGVSVKLDWQALMPPHNAIPEELSDNAAASFHLEQAGRVTGEIKFRKRAWKFDGVGNRDHAQGVRDWAKLGRHALAWPVFDDGTAMSIVRAYDDVSSDPFDLMWYFDGERVRPLKFVSYNARLNEEDYPLSATFVADDENGTRYELSCTRKAIIHWAIDGYLLLENAFEFRLPDGRVGYGLMELGMKQGVFTSEELSHLS